MNNYDYDIPKFTKIVRNIDTGELYSKFQIVDPNTFESTLKELGWTEPKTEVEQSYFTKFVLQSSNSYSSSGRYKKYKVISCYEDDKDGKLYINLGTYENNPEGDWIDHVKYSKPKSVDMIRWIKVDKFTVTMKMKIPVETTITLNI